LKRLFILYYKRKRLNFPVVFIVLMR